MPLVLLFLAAGAGLVAMNKIVNLRAGQTYLITAGIYPPIPEEFFPQWIESVYKVIAGASNVHLENRSMPNGLFSKRTVTLVFYQWAPDQDTVLRKGQDLVSFGASYGMTLIDASPMG